jgi:hypothetical protein
MAESCAQVEAQAWSQLTSALPPSDLKRRREGSIAKAHAALEAQRAARKTRLQEQKKCAQTMLSSAMASELLVRLSDQEDVHAALARATELWCAVDARSCATRCAAMCRAATDRQIDLDRRKRQEIERAKNEELAAERGQLSQWQRTLEADAGDESDEEESREVRTVHSPELLAVGYERNVHVYSCLAAHVLISPVAGTNGSLAWHLLALQHNAA